MSLTYRSPWHKSAFQNCLCDLTMPWVSRSPPSLSSTPDSSPGPESPPLLTPSQQSSNSVSSKSILLLKQRVWVTSRSRQRSTNRWFVFSCQTGHLERAYSLEKVVSGMSATAKKDQALPLPSANSTSRNTLQLYDQEEIISPVCKISPPTSVQRHTLSYQSLCIYSHI